MKNFIILTCMFFCLAGFSQQEKLETQLSTVEEADLKAKRLAMQLDLNEEQEQKLKVLYIKRIEERKEMLTERRAKREEILEERREQRKYIMELNREQKEELRSILTPEQFSSWEGLQEKRRKGRPTPEKN